MSHEKAKLLRWQEGALADLIEIVEHIAEDAPQAAEEFADAIFARIELRQDATTRSWEAGTVSFISTSTERPLRSEKRSRVPSPMYRKPAFRLPALSRTN